jgi:cytochrome P450
MKIVIRSVLRHYEIAPATASPEQTARRSITFSPKGGATVILSERTLKPAGEAQTVLTTA